VLFIFSLYCIVRVTEYGNPIENLKGTSTQQGKDRDEAPPAVINTGEKGKVKHITPSDNRGAGASIKNQIKDLPDGAKVTVVPKNLPKKTD
jgi:hypothetical protein